MKHFLLIWILVLSWITGFSQTDWYRRNEAVNIDTVQYLKVSIRCADPKYYLEGMKTVPIQDGYNVLLDSTGVILSEGYSKKNKRVGFWREYEEGRLVSIVEYDRKGNPQTWIKFDKHGIIEP
jgi:hypothetical protein